MKTSPNILLFLTDDHAAWACGCYGNQEVHTPNLDYLAENGVQMLNAFSPTPVCSPARACLMTGRLASQHGVHDYIGSTQGFDVDFNWMKDETLLPELFQQAGYETILVGKWHLGQERTKKQGFNQTFAIGPDYPILHQGPRTCYRNDTAVQNKGLLSETFTQEALHYLRNRSSEKPFFLVIGHYATHSPWLGHPEPLVASYRKKHIGSQLPEHQYPFGMLVNEAKDSTRENPTEALCQYYAAVTEIDNSVGTLLQELKNQNLSDSTVVIYTSDHGLNCGQHGLWGKGNATFPLNMVEESIRIPLLFHAPGTFLSRQRRPEFVDHTDVFNTILAIADIPDPESSIRNSPGTSFLHLLTHMYSTQQSKTMQFFEYGPVRMVRTNRYKLLVFPEPTQSLFFDLVTDPKEEINLFKEEQHQLFIEQLKTLIDAHFFRYSIPGKEGTSPQLPQFNPHVAWDYFKEYSL